MEPVKFIAELVKDVDGYAVQNELRTYAAHKGYEDLSTVVREFKFLGKQMIFGITTAEAYEDLFGAKLEYREYSPDKCTPYFVKEWIEVRHAKIPRKFKGRIKNIELDRKIHPFA